MLALSLVAVAGGPRRRALEPHMAAGAGTIVRIGDGGSPNYVVAPGERVTVPVEVVGAVNLGSATVLLSYNPVAVHAVGCAGPQSPAFDGGYCHIEDNLGTVQFNIVALDGVSGTHRLFDITFEAAAGGAGATRTDLTLTVEHFADLMGNTLEVSSAGGEIKIEGGQSFPDVVVRAGDETAGDYTVISGNSMAISTTLNITGTHKVGAATILLRYDPQVVRPTRCVQSDPVQGYCNPAFDPAKGLVKFDILSPEGLTGTVHPYNVTFEAASGVAAGASSVLVPVVENLVDTAGVPVSWQVVSGSIAVAAGSSNSGWALVGAPEEEGTYTITHGAIETVSVWVENVLDLGATTLSLHYDRSIVRALGCALSDDVAQMAGGACALQDGQVRASIIAPQGLNGNAHLFDVLFTPVSGVPAGTAGPLLLVVENFADTTANPVPSRARDGTITIASGSGGLPVALARPGDDSNGGVFDLPRGGRIVVPIRVEGVADLGAATLSLAYDPAVARVTDCTAGDDLFDGSFCNPKAGDGLARLNVMSLSGFTGDATLFGLTFQAADGAGVGARTGLTVTVTNFDSPAGKPLLYRTAPGLVTIGAPLEAPDVVLRAGQGPYQVEVGGRITVPILATTNANGIPLGLGAATLVLGYNPAVAQPVACTINDDAGKNSFDGGNCNLHYDIGQIKFNALSIAGLSGDTTIAEIAFLATGQGGDRTSLTLTVDHLADIAGNALTHDVVAGTIGIPPEDGNHDGIPDSRQDNVVSVRNAIDGSYVTLASPDGTGLENVRAMGNPSPSDAPGGVDFPAGFVSFKVRGVEVGGRTTVTLFLPAGMAVIQYFNFGGTPDNVAAHWYAFSFDGTTGAEVLPDRAILHFVDGLRGDADLAANGEIAGSGGPGVASTSTWVNFYGLAARADGTPLPEGTTVLAVDPDGVTCGAALIHKTGKYGLLTCYGDDPATLEDEGAQAGDTVRLVVGGQELATAGWGAHGDLLEVNLGAARPWRFYLPLVGHSGRWAGR